MQTLLSRDEITISKSIENQLIYAKWDGSFTNQQIMDYLKYLLKVFMLHEPKRYVADLLRFHPSEPYDQIWIKDVFFPKAYTHGLRYVAVVMPQDFIDKMPVMKSLEPKFEVIQNMFPSVESANSWILSQHN